MTRGFISRHGEGDRYALSRWPPIVKRVYGTERDDIYPTPGDPLWTPHICRAGVCVLFGDVQLEPLQSVAAELPKGRVCEAQC